jgi:hypothetical protein
MMRGNQTVAFTLVSMLTRILKPHDDIIDEASERRDSCLSLLTLSVL